MSYNQNFRYPPPGFEEHQARRPNPNFSANLQFENSSGPSRFHPQFNQPQTGYPYDSPHSRLPVHNTFVPSAPAPAPRRPPPPPPPPTMYQPKIQYANRFSVPPPPFNRTGGASGARIPYRSTERTFRATYPTSRTISAKNRFSNKWNYHRERDNNAPLTERHQQLLVNYCETSDEIHPNEKKDLPADVFYKRCKNGDVESTNRLDSLCTLFDQQLVARGPQIRKKQPPHHTVPPNRKHKFCARHKCK